MYRAVALCVLTASLGSYLHVAYHIGSVAWAFVGIVLAMGIMFTSSSSSPQTQSTRWALLFGFGLCEGLALGPLIELVLEIDSSIVLQALVATVVIFGCFSLSALYAQRRSMLYLGAILSSALSVLVWLSFLNIFFRSNLLFDINLYGGLLLFMGYVVFDTQVIVELASHGVYDVQGHALHLFIDLVGIFVRVLIILSKNKKEKKK